MGRLIFHVDVNSAFLSWEAAKRVAEGLDDLRLVPSVIGGDPEKRTGIVLAKSIPAKKYGIQTGEPMAMAVRKCPGLISAKPDFELYDRSSRAFKAICASFAPVMESFSIDEVFLDMTGTDYIYSDPVNTANEIREKIKNDLGFTVNIGIGPNKLLAKMASDFEKPDKVHTLFVDEIAEKMWPLPVGDLLFLGRASAGKLEGLGIKTIGQLAALREDDAKLILGDAAGHMLWNYANGNDDSPVKEERNEAKGYSAESTFEEDIVSLEQADAVMLSQVDMISARMRRDGKKCRCITVTMRDLDFKTKSHQLTLDSPTDVTEEIYRHAKRLFRESWKNQPLRLLGVGISELTTEDFAQFSLFDAAEDHEKQQKKDRAIDALRKKYGSDIISRGSTMGVSDKVSRKARAALDRHVKNNK